MLLGELIPRNARLNGSKTAVVFDGGTRSFRDYAAHAYQLANALIGLGLQRQDRISVMAQNGIEMLEAYGAGDVSGLIVHPINYRLTTPEVAYQLGDSEPGAVFFEAQFDDVLAPIHGQFPGIRRFIRIGGDGGDTPDWAVAFEDFIAGGAPTRPDMRPVQDDTAYLFYSSGSTGRPKGVRLGQAAQWNTALIVGYEFNMNTRDIGQVVMPLFHIGGRFFQLAHFMAGATVHMPRRFDAAAAAQTIERERITLTHLAPTMIRSILDLPDIDQRDLSSLRTIGYGAAAMPLALLRRALKRFGPILMQRYGSTEAAVVSYLDLHHHVVDGAPEDVARLSSAGKPGPMSEIRVERADGSECDVGETGLIMVRNPKLIMQGYWRNDAATSAVLRDGWYEMGDVGYLDAAGFLYIIDRKTEMIISGGENIYPREVEEAILHHPGVADAAVIGVPDDQWGESVLAFVVARDGESIDEAALIEFCGEHIASYKKPRRVEFRDRLPRNSAGKIDKVSLRKPFWEGRDRQV